MISTLLLILVILGLLKAVKSGKLLVGNDSADYQYRPNPKFLSRAEVPFYRALPAGLLSRRYSHQQGARFISTT